MTDDWRQSATCRGLNPELFHPHRGDNEEVRHAKAVCAGCPVIAACLDYAIRNREIIGIWGGTSENERKRMRMAKVRARDFIDSCHGCGCRLPYGGNGKPSKWCEECGPAVRRAQQQQRSRAASG
jgi:WhiB family redox-sensing transcriptional regulator